MPQVWPWSPIVVNQEAVSFPYISPIYGDTPKPARSYSPDGYFYSIFKGGNLQPNGQKRVCVIFSRNRLFDIGFDRNKPPVLSDFPILPP
jgi:hypothetical protein